MACVPTFPKGLMILKPSRIKKKNKSDATLFKFKTELLILSLWEGTFIVGLILACAVTAH